MSPRIRPLTEIAVVLSTCLALPAVADDGAVSTPEPTTKTFVYKSIPGGTLEIVVHYPHGWKETDRRPAIVFFFGGGWENGTIQAFQRHADHLARRGMVAARADYRVKSRQGVNPDKCVEDAKSAVRWLRANAARLGIDPDRIIASGGSAGGHIAACTALTEGLEAEGEDRTISSKPSALVLFNPVLQFHGFPAMMKRIDNDEAIGKAISPTLHVSKTTPPTLLLFGTADWLIGQGREFMRRSREAGSRAEMFTAEGEGHGFFHRPPWFQRTVARMDEFLASLGYLESKASGSSAADDWALLFDGKTLDGWKVNGGHAEYTVEDGAIVGKTVDGSPNTFLCKGDYRDFVLELEVQCDPQLNSGVQVRSHIYQTDDPKPENRKRAGVVYGPQCEIARRETGTAGRFYDEARRGRWLAEIRPEATGAFRDDGWNRYRIVVQGNRYRSWVNGIAASDSTDDVDERGFIGLQVHGIPRGAGPYQVRWRNIRIRELKPEESVAVGGDTASRAAASPGADKLTQPKRSVLIVDGVNNHDWERATRILKSILLGSGRFTVDVATSPPANAPSERWQAWRPDFARYDVVVMNFNGGHTTKGVHWPRDLEKSLEDYVSKGGGLVSYHAANNSFPNWPAYNRMIGLGWRDKNFGPSLVVSGDGKVVEIPRGQGRSPGHGPEHDFVVTVLDADHPITRGLPKNWLHPHEQLTHGQHGPATGLTVLTYAHSKDTGQNEVMDWVIPFGKGRVYTTMLGHLWNNGPETAMQCVGFQTMLIRAVEWAATGQVNYPVPDDFPTASEIRLRAGDETTAPTPPEGFKAVFDGRDLTGWEGSPKYWSVEDGCLTGKADGTLRFNRFLTWRGGTVRNFELRVKVKVSPTGNSGLQYRGTERPDLGESVVTGYQCDVVANRPDYNGMLYEERGRRILAHTGEKVVIDPQGQPWVVGQFPLKAFRPGEWHDYRVVAEANHYRHWIDGHPTVDVIDLDEKGRKLDGVLAVQVHVGPPMTIQYKDFFLKALPDDLPIITREQAPNPPDARKVVPQGQDRPKKPDAE